MGAGAPGPDAGHGPALGSRLSALGSRLSALGSRLSALGSRLSALGSRLSALGSRLSKHDAPHFARRGLGTHDEWSPQPDRCRVQTLRRAGLDGITSSHPPSAAQSPQASRNPAAGQGIPAQALVNPPIWEVSGVSRGVEEGDRQRRGGGFAARTWRTSWTCPVAPGLRQTCLVSQSTLSSGRPAAATQDLECRPVGLQHAPPRSECTTPMRSLSGAPASPEPSGPVAARAWRTGTDTPARIGTVTGSACACPAVCQWFSPAREPSGRSFPSTPACSGPVEQSGRSGRLSDRTPCCS